MPLKCTLRPNRTEERRFKLNDAARIACYAIREGATRAQLFEEIERRCGGRGGRGAGELAAMAARALADTDSVLADAIAAFAAILLVLALIRFIGRTPLTLPLRVAAQAAISRINAIQTTLSAQRAANQEVYAIMVEEAANAAQFAIRAGAR